MKPLTEQIGTYSWNENMLLHFHIGRAVKIREFCRIHAKWGHVTGFTLNPSGETILVLRTELGTEQKIHPANVEIG